MIENHRQAQWIVALLVAGIIAAGLLVSLGPVSREARQTGALLAKAAMRDSVNRYQQMWLTSGEPQLMRVGQAELSMNDNGLVLPVNPHRQFDCRYWLAVHYPQRKIMASELKKVHGERKNDGYRCYYRYQSGQKVVVSFSANALKIDVEIPTE
ncbi:MSHA biogenesis protein MshF [Vibrio sp. CAU 1672]|uniref:MSHA biogenesis protein MshF n=1 Tax=Vibrio sp. CAU 1672 TaxID=3032594 RepID=UPI0023DBAEB6|nr:MSHA biogenesis protein MshF [Vibrio sp. CAU 1672]MDF2155628.1 MSHA biogenesis protein MshF [Vibrio sp. CAU 1672]